MENVNTFVVVDRFWWGLILISLKNKKKKQTDLDMLVSFLMANYG